MDNQKFGTFISTLRKEKGWTQRDLAEHLDVTDKAVSKWERGLGFPDIKTIEPLADALNVSILEIMRSERIQEEQVSTNSATEALASVIDVVTYQRKLERRNIIISLIAVSSIIMTIFLIDTMEWIGFLMICLPVIFVVTGMLLLIISWKRYKQKLSYSITLILGILLAMVNIGIYFMDFMAGMCITVFLCIYFVVISTLLYRNKPLIMNEFINFATQNFTGL